MEDGKHSLRRVHVLRYTTDFLLTRLSFSCYILQDRLKRHRYPNQLTIVAFSHALHHGHPPSYHRRTHQLGPASPAM